MELKSLLLGLAFSLGIFAVKSGAGLSYLMQQETGPRRWAIFCCCQVSYLLSFLLAGYLIHQGNLMEHLEGFMLFLQNGMTLHCLLAALLLLWGAALLKRPPENRSKSSGWLLLSLPCPVCFAVILFIGGFLQALYPKTPWLFVWLYLSFFAVSCISAFIVSYMKSSEPIHGLGTVMVLTALYFLITILVVPQFSDIDKIYRLSKSGLAPLNHHSSPWLFIVMGITFFVGVLSSSYKKIGMHYKRTYEHGNNSTL
ncbi:DUF2162 family putative transporter [Desulfogranum marinum]|uniref:DUF2162 family putative transporter n=1 Tax=Desulfogranum marinum TaxID=453220 RepID=UPI0029C7A1F1|nr:DUF2162 family putative transporter [Desulfogranum marinum]